MRICIVGGGSLEIVCAGVFMTQGIEVNLLTGHPENWSTDIEVNDPGGNRFSGTLSVITTNPAEAVKEA